MKYLILMGSPRKEGNTVSLVRPFMEELEKAGNEAEMIWLYDKEIHGCVACRACQKDWTVFGCQFHDDMYEIFDKILAADVLVFATPIYSWYCTAPMKALMDRLVYGMNKYYGDERGPALWKGKPAALIMTCGYPPEKGADVFEAGFRRYCKHSQLVYQGMTAQHDLGYKSEFRSPEKEEASRAFARELMEKNAEKA